MRWFSGVFLCAAVFAQQPDVRVFDQLSWRSVGPAVMGGRATDVEGVPGNPLIVYAATGGGGLFKTMNGGMSWTPIFERENTFSVGDIALDPRNPEVIWVGTGEANMRNSVSFGDGVYKSIDGGKTWQHLGLKETEHIARVILNPHTPETAYVCALGHQSGANEERGVFMTTDNGKTWQKTLYLDDKHGCADLDIDPVNPNVLFASMWRFDRKPWTHTSGSEESGVFRSADGGRTWKKITEGLPKLVGRTGVKVAASDPRIVYVIAESKEGTMYRSNDGGVKFAEVSKERDIVSRGFYYADFRVDPTDANRIYTLATDMKLSVDGGKTFRNISASMHSDYHGLWIDPTNPKRIWQAQDGGFGVSHDRGETWEAVSNIPLAQFYQIHADNRMPFYHISGGLQDNGTWTGPSRTRGSSILNDDWLMVSFGDGFYAVSHPDDPDLFLTESQGGAIVQTDMRTREQQSVSPQPKRGFVADVKYRFNWNTPIQPSPHGKSTVYFGSNVLFQSRDFGGNFEPISPDLTVGNKERLKPAGGPVWFDNSTAENYGTVVTVAESAARAGVIWAGTDDGNVQVTRDNGKTWTNVARNVPGVPQDSVVSHVEPSRTGADTAYVAFDRHLFDDYKPYIFRTTDGGKTWTNIAGNLPAKAYVQIVREDPKNAKLLYAGTELGLYASWTGGGEWSRLGMKDLPNVAVHDIIVHPRENDLILGTHGRSIQIFDDATPIQQMTPAIAESAAHLFDIRAALRTPQRSWRAFSDDKTFAGKNPAYGALVTYHLKDKLDAKAEFKLEVLDGSGKVIRSLKNMPREKGLNRVNWDLRYDGPKLRVEPTESETRFGRGPAGPQAVPGRYTVRMTVGGKSYDKPVEVRLDPALKVSGEQLQSQLKSGLRLRDLASAVNTALLRLDALRVQLDGVEKEGGAAVKESAAAARKALDAAISRLGTPLRSNRLETPPGLAEGLSGLYFTIGGPNAGPTAPQSVYQAELEKEAVSRLAEVNAGMAKSVGEWNAGWRKSGLAGLSDWKLVSVE